jgi:hypothetical protein
MADNKNNMGLYLPTTYIFDIQEVEQADINSPEFKDLLVRLYQNVNDIVLAVNLKTTGYHLTTEFNTGSLLFNINNDFTQLRNIFRVTVNFGALPAAGTKSVAHSIPFIGSTYSFTTINGAATNPSTPEFIPIPFSSAVDIAHNLQITVDATMVNITTGGTDYSAYTTTWITLEFVKII